MPYYQGVTSTGIGKMAERQGIQNLYQMLATQGNIDPRVMASMQAQNARATQQQQDAARAQAARGGFSRGGLAQALQSSIGAAGANRAAGIQYQNAMDAYGRNQQNIGLLGQVVQQPNLGYMNLNEGARQFQGQMNAQKRAAAIGAFSSVLGAAGGAAGGCWVAEAIFGKDAVETHLARIYVNTLASAEFKAAYLQNGEELAEIVKDDEAMKAALRPTFLAFGQVALEA